MCNRWQLKQQLCNIAEGFERGTNSELVRFLYFAKGSAGEVRAQLLVALDQVYISQADYNDLKDRCRRISGMLNNLISYLREPRFADRNKQKHGDKNFPEDPKPITKS